VYSITTFTTIESYIIKLQRIRRKTWNICLEINNYNFTSQWPTCFNEYTCSHVKVNCKDDEDTYHCHCRYSSGSQYTGHTGDQSRLADSDTDLFADHTDWCQGQRALYQQHGKHMLHTNTQYFLKRFMSNDCECLSLCPCFHYTLTRLSLTNKDLLTYFFNFSTFFYFSILYCDLLLIELCVERRLLNNSMARREMQSN